MTSGNTELQRIIGPDADAYPLVADRIAIDLTNALRGAEAGLRGFRGRPILRRVVGGITGSGQELQSAIGQDIVVTQHAMLALVKAVMSETERTKTCMNKVLRNLRAVKPYVDELSRRESQALRVELHEVIRTESAQLLATIEKVKVQVDREATVRRLTERYRAGDLTEGLGMAAGSGLFLATIEWHYWGEERERLEREKKAALAVVRQRLSDPRPRPMDEAALEAAASVSQGALETLLYLAAPASGVLRATGMLAERRIAGLPLCEEHAQDAVAITRCVSDPDRQLEDAYIRDWEVAEFIAKELRPLTDIEME